MSRHRRQASRVIPPEIFSGEESPTALETNLVGTAGHGSSASSAEKSTKPLPSTHQQASVTPVMENKAPAAGRPGQSWSRWIYVYLLALCCFCFLVQFPTFIFFFFCFLVCRFSLSLSLSWNRRVRVKTGFNTVKEIMRLSPLVNKSVIWSWKSPENKMMENSYWDCEVNIKKTWYKKKVQVL